MFSRWRYDGRDRGHLLAAAADSDGERRALVVLGVAGVALGLVLAAFYAGRGVGGHVEETSGPADAPSSSQAQESTRTGSSARRLGSPTPSASRSAARATSPSGRLAGRPYAGPVGEARVSGVRATCRAPSSVDAGGNPVGYAAANVLDGRASTAWRCPGSGRSQRLVLRLARPRLIAAVGLIPGYAKTDPFNGTDRYAENRRISRVRWEFGGGAWVEQRFDTSRDVRRLQTMRIPPVRSGTVTLVIQASTPAPRNTVAVSAVRLGTPRG